MKFKIKTMKSDPTALTYSIDIVCEDGSVLTRTVGSLAELQDQLRAYCQWCTEGKKLKDAASDALEV